MTTVFQFRNGDGQQRYYAMVSYEWTQPREMYGEQVIGMLLLTTTAAAAERMGERMLDQEHISKDALLSAIQNQKGGLLALSSRQWEALIAAVAGGDVRKVEQG